MKEEWQFLFCLFNLADETNSRRLCLLLTGFSWTFAAASSISFKRKAREWGGIKKRKISILKYLDPVVYLESNGLWYLFLLVIFRSKNNTHKMPVRHRTQTQCMTEVHAHDTEAVTIFISLCTLFGGQTLTSGNALQPFPPPSDSEVF